MASIKLSQWAKENNYSYGGALKSFHAGNIPHSYQLPSGTILVDIDNKISKSNNSLIRAALYARVSTRKQSDSLKNQSKRLNNFAIGRGYEISHDISEIGSGLNGNRKKLHQLLNNHNSWDVLVVEHKDRLARFGTEFIETLLSQLGKQVIYVYSEKEKGDIESLTEDIISVITSLSDRFYGKRAAEIKAKNAVREVIPDDIQS